MQKFITGFAFAVWIFGILEVCEDYAKAIKEVMKRRREHSDG